MDTTTLQTTAPQFSPDFFRFFREIKKNNHREWFQANKERYETVVKAPCLALIEAVGPGLHKISAQVVADPRPVGGSMFRIFRDIRFSKDKSPYKTHAGIHFSHRGNTEECHYPGFYLHLEPGESGIYAGVWQPDTPRLQRVREAIASKPQAWKRVKEGWTLYGDSLKRVPSGFDPDHLLAEDLKRKDFLIEESVSDAQVTSPDFVKTFLKKCQEMEPFNAFLAKAMGAPW